MFCFPKHRSSLLNFCKMFDTHVEFSCLFYVIFVIFFVFSPSFLFAEVDERYTNCHINSTCGTNRISYPFWESNLPEYCGHPGFKLDCQGDSATIDIADQTYDILKIDYNDYILTIANSAFSNGSCPPTLTQLTNSTLEPTLFNLTSSSQNATLFYGCPQATVAQNATYEFSCPPSNPYFSSSISTIGFLATEERAARGINGPCQVEVYNPVLTAAVIELANGSPDVGNALRQGFEVKWNIDDKQCDACTNSGGVCGYNYTLKKPSCFCMDGAYGGSCNDPKTQLDQTSSGPSPNNNSRRLIIGFAASGSIVMLSVLFFLYWHHQHKEKGSARSFPIQNKTLNASLATSNLQAMNHSTYFGLQVFSFRELEEATDEFNALKELGDGGFGTVYHGKLQDGREVAIKRLYEHNKRAEQFMNEVEILAHLRHKNLVTLYGCTHRQSQELLLVYQYMPNGTVSDHLHGKRAKNSLLPWPTRLSIAIQTASALVYLHSSDIIHRDVKTQNLLLDRDFSVKVADFGLSRLFPLDATHVSTAPQGTPGYVDPEYHQCYQLTEKSDVFSFGVVLAELISSKPAVDITRRRQEINLSSMAVNKIQNHVLHEFVDPDLGFESDCEVKEEITGVAELALWCLQSTSDMRPLMEEVLEMLERIQGQPSKVDEADEVDIPSDDVFMLKSDLSPTSPIRDYNFVRRHIPHASV